MNNLMDQHLSRRRFLKKTLLGSLFLPASRLLPFTEENRLIPDETRQILSFFSPKEYLIIQAAAERIVGKPGPGQIGARDIDVALRADRFLAAMDSEIQEQFHQLLTVFNSPFFTFLFDFRFSSFINMHPQDQDTYLEDWMTSRLGFRRTGFQALKRTCLSMFYTEAHSWEEIEFDARFEAAPATRQIDRLNR